MSRACTPEYLPLPPCLPNKFFGRREGFVHAGVSGKSLLQLRTQHSELLTKSSLAFKARGSETDSTPSRFQFHLIVIPAEAGIQNNNRKEKFLDTRFREYDKIKQLVSRFGSCSLCSHFAQFPFASRRGVPTIPEGDTN